MRILLLPFSLFYWLGVAVRNWFFDIGVLTSQKVTAPVISVGNISAGGVGKTPFVEMLIERLKIDHCVAVVSRGYQMFLRTPSGKEIPALADQLKKLHAFDEDLREGLGLTSLYNLSLGTTSDDHLYDRVEDRDQPHHPRPWETKAVR